MVDESGKTQSCTPELGNHNFVTGSPFSPCTDNVLHDVVTVYPTNRKSSAYKELERGVLLAYALGDSTQDIANDLNEICGERVCTEADVFNTVFGTRASHRQPNAGTPAPASTATPQKGVSS